MTSIITVAWDIWADGEKRYQTFIKNNEKEPNYVTIEGNRVQLKDWKDSQKSVSKFKKDNKNKNPPNVRLTIPSTIKPIAEKGDTITPPNHNRGVKTDGYYYCSCGEKGYKHGRWKVTFVNRCAFADDKSHKHKSSRLMWSDKADVAPLEGQWTCEGCDADYCVVTGKEKIAKSQRRLTKIKEEKMPKKS